MEDATGQGQAQETASGQEQKPPQAPSVDELAKELGVARGELKALQEAKVKLEHDNASLRGTVAERYDQRKEISAIRREMQEQRNYIADLVEAQATGEPERVAGVKASWASRAQQAETADSVTQEATEIYYNICSEAEEMGLKISPNAPPPEEFADVATLWNEGFNADPSKLRIGPLRRALRLAGDKRRAFQKNRDVEREVQMQKEITEQVKEAKKKAGILDTPLPQAAGKSGLNLQDVDALKNLDMADMTPDELEKIRLEIRRAKRAAFRS